MADEANKVNGQWKKLVTLPSAAVFLRKLEKWLDQRAEHSERALTFETRDRKAFHKIAAAIYLWNKKMPRIKESLKYLLPSLLSTVPSLSS